MLTLLFLYMAFLVRLQPATHGEIHWPIYADEIKQNSETPREPRWKVR